MRIDVASRCTPRSRHTLPKSAQPARGAARESGMSDEPAAAEADLKLCTEWARSHKRITLHEERPRVLFT